MAEIIELGIVSIKNCGEYDSETNYEKLNVVTYQGSSYCAKRDTIGNLPTDTDYWQLYAQKGDTGDTGDIGPQGPKPVKGVDYYTSEDIAELESTLANDVTDEVTEQLGNLTSTTPLAVNSITDMVDTTRVYVNTTDGHWYWYNGSSWQDGGVYQATEIPDNSIVYKKFKETTILSENIFDNSVYYNGYIGSDGTVHENVTSSSGLNLYTDYLPLNANGKNKIIPYGKANFIFYDSSKQYISGTSAVTTAQTIPNDAVYVRASILSSNLDTQGIFQSDYVPVDTTFRYKINKLITDKDLLFNGDKLANTILSSYTNPFRNKFDFTNIHDGMITSTGAISNSTATFQHPFYSDFYEIKPNTNYYFGGAAFNVYACWYDSNKNFIERVTCSNQIKTSPANASYVRICSDKDRINLLTFIECNNRTYLPKNFCIENLKIGRNRPSALGDLMNEKHYDFDYLLGSANYGEYITRENNIYFEEQITINKNLTSENQVNLTYYMIAKSKVIEIEFDCKCVGTNYVLISNINNQAAGDNVISAEARSIALSNTTWQHKKVRYVIPAWLPIIEVLFRTPANCSLELSNININFVERATNTNNAVLKFVGHQGLPYVAPRNTIPCFEYAIAGGMDSCVINVNYTSDGEIVCLHNDTIDATSTGTGNIHDMTYDQANQYDYGSRFNTYYTGTKLPKLEEVLDLFAKHGVKPIIRWNNAIVGENKTKLMNMLSKNGIKNKVTILGFDLPVLLPLKQEYPDFRYAYCGYDTVDQTLINNLKALGDNTIYDCDYTNLTSNTVKLMHDNNIEVCTWFANNQIQLANAYDMGVDYIKTDYYVLQNCDF